jgi:hypothetical protein
MTQPTVQDLFRTAMAHDDAAAMRAGLERLLGVSDGHGLDAAGEYALRAPGFVMEMPQPGERIRGRDAMRSMQLHYGEGPWCVALVIELDDDALIAKETRYYAERSEPPAWRAAWVEAM